MDPYLENTALWPGFHNALMLYARDAIQPRLPESYVATLEVRVYFERLSGGAEEDRLPDLEVVRPRKLGGGGQLAVSERPADLQGYWIDDPPLEHREAYVAIRDLEDDELVTSLELLSPSNKHTGKGRREYLRKQTEMIEAGVNLVEIDLLRSGRHTVALGEGALAQLPPHTYLSCIHRAAQPWGFQVIPWGLRDPLPSVPIPLAPNDSELELDLAAVFTETHDRGRFDRLLRVRTPLVPSLNEDDAAWVQARLDPVGQGIPRG